MAAAAGAGALAAACAAARLASPSGGALEARVLARLRARSGRFVRSTGWRLREAVVATEDERFFRHHGIDPTGAARAPCRSPALCDYSRREAAATVLATTAVAIPLLAVALLLAGVL